MQLPEKWWQDKATFERVVAEFGHNLSAASRALGGPAMVTLSKWHLKHGFPPMQGGRKVSTVDPDATVSEEEMLRQRVSELEKLALAGRKDDVLRERMVAALKVELRAKEPTYSPRVIAKPRKADEHQMALLWSDTHAGEVVSPEETDGLGGYDWRTMMDRHDQITRGLLSYVSNRPYPVRKLHVWALGDMLSGNIHHELAETNEFPLVECAVQFGLDAGEWLEQLVGEFEQIRFAGVVGNHPRLSQKPQAKRKYDNMDWLVYHTMQQRLRAYGSIRWEIPKAQKWPVEVCGRRVVLTHGDGIRSTMVGVPWGGIIRHYEKLVNLYARAGKPIDYLACGHWHEGNVVKNRRIIVNGSVKGIDEYGIHQHGGGEAPHQLLATFHPRRGLTDVSWIDLA